MASRCSFLCLTAALVVAALLSGTGAQRTQCSIVPQFVSARTDVTGLIQSPNYPNDYPDNARCRWKIGANLGYVVHLYVLDLELEAHSNCSFDSISIFDGGYRSRPLAKLCGNSSQYMSYYSTRRFMLLDFRSDDSVVGRGFQLRYRAVLPSQANYNTTTTTRRPTTSTTSPATTTMNPWWTGAQWTTPATSTTSAMSPMTTMMNPWWTGAPGTQCSIVPQFVSARTDVTGVILSPNYPNDYPNNARCRWKIGANPGYVVHLYVVDLELEAHSNCSFDSISIFDGGYRWRYTPLLAKLCGNSSQYMSYYSTRRFMLLDFRSDDSVVGRGFQLRYRAVLPSQANYNTTTTRPATSTTSPTTTTVNPWFSSDRCRFGVTQNLFANPSVTQVLRLHNYPNQYHSNSNCGWKIQARQGYVVRLYVSRIDLEESVSCSFDSITLFDGGSPAFSPRLATLCHDTDQGRQFYSTGRYIYVRFTSDNSVGGDGFQLDYEAILSSQVDHNTTTTTTTPWPFGEVCLFGVTQHLSASQGVIHSLHSPNHPNSYHSNSNCGWKIEASQGYVVRLYVARIDLEESDNCGFDSITVFDGGSPVYSPRLATLCHDTDQGSQFYSTGRYIYVKFTSDNSVTDSGFQLDYEAVQSSQVYPDTTTIMPWPASGGQCRFGVTQSLFADPSFTQSFHVPNYSGHYHSNSDCGWKIEARQGYVVRLYVARIDLEENDDCSFDSLTVFDGGSPVYSPRLATLCHDTDQGRQFHSSGRYMYVKFTSDQPIVRSGFQLDYDAVQSSEADPDATTFMPWWYRTTTTADRYRSLYKHSSAALIGGLTVGLVGALAFLFAVVIVCRRRNKRARTPPPPPSSPAQDPSVLYHNNAVFMVPNVACMSPSLGYTNMGYTNMGYTSCEASSPPAYATLQFSTLAAQPSEKTGPPNSMAAQPSGQTGPPNTLAAQPIGQTGPPNSMAAQPSGENGPPNSMDAQPSGENGPPSSMAAQTSGENGPPSSMAAQPSGQTGTPQTGPSETMSV